MKKREGYHRTMEKNKPVRLSWLILMAWRDSRRNRSRLLLFVSSIILGIAALVATLSFGSDVRDSIDGQAKALVGADLVIRSNRPLSPQLQLLPDSLHNRHSVECNFASMIYFVSSQGTRLVQVRALDGDYPFYGSLETTPARAGMSFRSGREALVDKTVLLQYGAHVGDSIRIGNLGFVIAGSLDKAPGRNELSTTVAPPVYIPFKYLSQTGLLQRGSRTEYQYYYQYSDAVDMDKLVAAIGPRLEKAGLGYETVATRKRRMSNAFEDFTEFLTLISFIALLLGCIGVASAVHIYIREKINGIAVLRCLGLKSRHAFCIYLIQVAGIGLIGSVAGAALGLIIQQLLPVVFKDLLPLDTNVHLSWPAIGQGIATGMLVSILFALTPLLSIRKISPLYTLRLSVEPAALPRNPFKAIVYALILLFIADFSFRQMHSWSKAIVFTASLLVAFLVLAAAAGLLMWGVRHLFTGRWNYLWRQGFANLYRPNNQTLILIITIGLGTTFISTLYFVQDMLIKQVLLSSANSRGNMVLFDIQTDQQKGIDSLAARYNIAVLQEMPIVTVRLEKVNGRKGEDSLGSEDGGVRERGGQGNGAPGAGDERRGEQDRGGVRVRSRPGSEGPGREGPRGGSRVREAGNEMRVTYRDSLAPTEKIVAGKLGPPVRSPKDPVYVSLDGEYARRARLAIGDTLVFNVQGQPITTIVGSLREDEWRLQINFRVIFPSGVLEQAPQFHVLIARVSTPEVSARFQQQVVKNFSNVSVIDLGLVLSVLEELLDKIGFVIRFMAGFSMLTGVIVLIASVLISKYQRIQESVLLRTLGASRRQILIITTLEYFFLGALAAATGIFLSILGSWALGKYIFNLPFSPQWKMILLLFSGVSGLTILIGLYNSREVLHKPPLEILRSEV